MAPLDTGMAAMLIAPGCRLVSSTVSTHSMAGTPPVGVTVVMAPNDPVLSPKSDAATLLTAAPNKAVNVTTLWFTVAPSAAVADEYVTVTKQLSHGPPQSMPSSPMSTSHRPLPHRVNGTLHSACSDVVHGLATHNTSQQWRRVSTC